MCLKKGVWVEEKGGVIRLSSGEGSGSRDQREGAKEDREGRAGSLDKLLPPESLPNF